MGDKTELVERIAQKLGTSEWAKTSVEFMMTHGVAWVECVINDAEMEEAFRAYARDYIDLLRELRAEH